MCNLFGVGKYIICGNASEACEIIVMVLLLISFCITVAVMGDQRLTSPQAVSSCSCNCNLEPKSTSRNRLQ